MSNIEWTELTWNPLTGCDKITAGCKNCYAIRMAWRLMHSPHKVISDKYAGTVYKTGGGNLNWTGKVNTLFTELNKPLLNKKPSVYFVNSMSDMFHEKVPVSFIADVFAIMWLANQHTYQVLTKRAERMFDVLTSKEFKARLTESCNDLHHKYIKPLEQPLYFHEEVMGEYPLKNVWLGVSVEDQKQADYRIPFLLKTPAAIRFLSCEPLLGPVSLTRIKQYNSKGAYIASYQVLEPIKNCGDSSRPAIDWVIAGGESGPNSRPMHPEWVRTLRDQCEAAGAAFFFKQWGNWLPFEETAQPPFFSRADTNEEYDGHCLNFIDVETNGPGKFGKYRWMDTMDAIILCEAENSKQVSFLNVPKHESGSLLDGKEHKQYPTLQA